MVWGRVRVAPAKTQSGDGFTALWIDPLGSTSALRTGGRKARTSPVYHPKLLKPSYLLGSDITSL